jgi:cytochrome c5
MKTTILLCIVITLVYSAFAVAAEQGFIKEGSKRSIALPTSAVSLMEGQGMDATSRYCRICHSLDYITTQQKFSKAKWQAEVTKMIKVYGAPISEDNAKIIAEYIASHYGTGG